MPFTEEYKKLLFLGRGSFAAVYKVRHNKLGYVRAIKISNEIVDNENDKAYQAFLNECRLLLQIGNGCHPNIIHIHQPRLIHNHALVEMDYVDGQTLNNYIRDKRFIDIDEFWRFAEGIVGAVGYCHADLYKFLMDPDTDNLEPDPDDGSKYLITPEKERELRARYCVNHNDLHSNNIMRRNYDGMFILLDFGLAIQKEHCVKSSSRADGAYEYSSPEKLDGKDITSASDVYSLGILMYEVLTGQVPFVMGSSNSMADISNIYDRQLHEKPAPIEPLRKKAYEETHPGKTYKKDYPDELERLIMKCLEKRPEDRYADAKLALFDLRKAKITGSRQSEDSELIKTLRQQIDELEREIERSRTASNGPRSFAATNRSQESPYKIGEFLDGGRISYIDQSGLHGLLMMSVSGTPKQWLRKVDEEDYEKFTFQSKLWYKDNCFIVPRGTHLPTTIELQNIMPNVDRLDIDRPVWIGSPIQGQPKALDLRSGRMLDGGRNANMFIALKAF